MFREINAVIADAETVEDFSRAFEFSVFLHFRADDFLGQTAEFAEDVELKFLGHLGEFASAHGIEDNLERTHGSGVASRVGSAYGNRTRLSALRGPCPN